MALEPEPAWDRGRLHAATLGEIGEEQTDEEQGGWERRRDRGKVCVICGMPVNNRSQGACHLHAEEWKRVKRSPRRLAEWIAEHADDRRYRDVVVWTR